MSDSPFSQHNVYSEQIRRLRRKERHIVIRYIMMLGEKLHAAMRVVLHLLHKCYVWLRSSRSRGEFARRLSFVVAGCFVVGIVWGMLYLAFITFTLPDVDEVGALFAAESTVITDRNGIELYRIHGDEDRTLVPLEQISDHIKHATIAIEDRRFYERDCLDIRALARVVLRFGSAGGGSTITRQHARNALGLKRESLVSRKLKEIILGCQLESRYSKDEVLELYLNRIPYGHNAHGVEQASKNYFAKSASGLTLAEASVLASLPQAPTWYSPYGKHVRTTLSEKGQERFEKGELKDLDDLQDDDFWMGLVGECFEKRVEGEIEGVEGVDEEVELVEEELLITPNDRCDGLFIGGRTDQVLQNMQNQGYISDEERIAALNELQMKEFKRARENIRAPHFVLWIREYIEKEFADQFEKGFLESGGLHVTTTLDWNLQQIAEGVIGEIGENNINLYDAHNAALLAADPDTGQILAYVGNRDYWDEETDGNVDIIQAPRQPGSSFKPFAYAATFLNGYSPATVLYDVPTLIGDDMPENFDNKFWGPLTIRKALGASRNVPAAKAFFLGGGEEAIVELAADMGIPSIRTRRDELTQARGVRYEYGWPLALGAAEIPLLELLQGYTTFARGGSAIPFVPILKIEDRYGNILFETPQQKDPNDNVKKKAIEGRDVLDPRAAYMITSILSDESARPEEYWKTQLTIPGYQSAAKTGTSNKCLERDSVTNVCRDSKPDNTWTIGYTPEIVAGAWAGNASGGALFIKGSGLNTASPIWRRFMIGAHKEWGSKKATFSVPEDIESAQISELSGELASPCTPVEYRRAEIFFDGASPSKFDSACREIEVDKLTGLLASDECPIEAREAGSFFAPRSILPDRWPLWEKAVREWATDLSLSPDHSRAEIADLMEPLNLSTERDSVFWKTVGRDSAGNLIRIFRGTGAFLPLPLPLAPLEECRLDLTPGRLEKPTLEITSPASNGKATAPIFRPEIRYTVGNAVREVRYELDGRLVGTGKPETVLEPTIRLPRRFDTSGIHSLKVTLIDSYYNSVSHSVRFTFTEDTSGPSVRILAPLAGATFSSGDSVTVRVMASDAGGLLDRVQFFLGDALLTTRREAPFEVTVTLDRDPGPVVIRAVAQDSARNSVEDEVVVEVR